MEEEKKSKETNNKKLNKQAFEKETLEEKNKHKKMYKCFIVLGIILVVLVILSTGFAIVNINNTNIIAGVTIDNVNVQGLDLDDARNLIEKKAEQKLNSEVKVKIDSEEYTLIFSQIELEYNIDEAIQKAYNIGRQKNIFVNNFEILKSKLFGINIDLNANYNEELLDNIITEINGKIPNAVKEATYYIEDDSLIITRGKAGISINSEELKNYIKKSINLSNYGDIEINTINAEPKDIDIDAIYNEVYTEVQDAYYTKNPFQVYPEVKGIDFNLDEAKEMLKEYKEEYIIPLVITNPKKTINDIGTEAFPDLLSTFSTRYDASNGSRTTNLKLAANKINGVVVMPGETFSYNKTLGKRTSEAGYKDAAGYAGGKVVQTIGGGICQISSTLYDAVLYANLDIVERHNHAFQTSYVGVGKDATVVYGALDFKFKNTRNYPITIKAVVQNGIAKIDIYGVKEDVEYEVEISSSVLSYLPYSVIYEDDASLAEGVEKVTQYGSRGCKSITYKILKLNGTEVSRTVLSTDTYDPMNKYISRGVKKNTTVNEPVTPTISPEPEIPNTPEIPATPEEPEMPTHPEEQPTVPEEQPEITDEAA